MVGSWADSVSSAGGFGAFFCPVSEEEFLALEAGQAVFLPGSGPPACRAAARPRGRQVAGDGRLVSA